MAAEGDPEVVMFSGGEPSIHPAILEFCAMARDKGVRSVVLNTNGIRLAHDATFATALAELDVRIYLQFDGLDAATHLAFRGRDLRAAKAKALDRCADAGLAVLLVAAVDAETNLDQVGAIVRHGIGHRAVRGVVFQPVTRAGRTPTFDPRTRLTNPEVIKALVEQCPDWFRVSDFFPVPCCFPTCRSITYLLGDDEDVIPITRLLPIENYLDYVTNRRRLLRAHRDWPVGVIAEASRRVVRRDHVRPVTCSSRRPEGGGGNDERARQDRVRLRARQRRLGRRRRARVGHAVSWVHWFDEQRLHGI